MKFIKLENYNVVITDDADEAVELIPGGLIHSMTASPLNDVVSIKKLDGVVLPIAVASVTATKINPAAEVPFAGVNAGDLIDLLSADFFSLVLAVAPKVLILQALCHCLLFLIGMSILIPSQGV